jgi:hypothetical protein
MVYARVNGLVHVILGYLSSERFYVFQKEVVDGKKALEKDVNCNVRFLNNPSTEGCKRWCFQQKVG